MSNNLKDQLTAEMKLAMKAKDKDRLLVIRNMLAAIKQVEIDGKVILDDAMILAVLDKMLKQRRDSYQQFTEAGRTDLAEKEAYEMTVIQAFMPLPLTQEEIEKMVEVAVAQAEAKTMQDMGKVMGILKPKMQGRVDMAEVSKKIKSKLGQ